MAAQPAPRRHVQPGGRVVGGDLDGAADRDNPTSTGVYQRIGFRPVAEWDDWRLEY